MQRLQTQDEIGQVRYFDSAPEYRFMFSICSLVARQDSYDRLLRSFANNGFTDQNSEFLAADNRTSNQFDGYGWQRRLYPECSGKYVIFCHDDIELEHDGFDELCAKLDALTELDPHWVLAGNAGGRKGHLDGQSEGAEETKVIHLRGRRKSYHVDDPFTRVETLDENFIVMRQDRFVGCSFDLNGFHHYGPDMCLLAEFSGGRSYVMDYLLRHHGAGAKGPAFRESLARFSEKYTRYYPGRTLFTTTGEIQL